MSEISHALFDVIVIGAGINGAGIARDAAMRGLKVLLLDKGDVGGGTSSWSTRLIHGGLRYLEHGEFGLVRESLRERECLLNIAPHLVRPLEILVPIYGNARRGVWTMRIGMTVYDILSFDKSLPRHHMLSREETLAKLPGLNPENLRGAAVYFDAQVEFAERLVVENVLSAVKHDAKVVTYARVDKFIVEDGKVRGVEFTRAQSPTSNVQRPTSRAGNQDEVSRGDQDQVSQSLESRAQDEMSRGKEGGTSTPAGLPRWGPRLAPALSPSRDACPTVRDAVTGRVVINAAGPWVDELLAQTSGNSNRLIGATKGSHLIVAPFPGAPETAVYVEAETDSRPFFIIPWNGNYLIGTTDIRYEGDLDAVNINSDEFDYLLRETNRVIPKANLTRQHVLYTYSGVRPLAFAGNKDEQSITRKHFIRQHPSVDNLFSIVGGKLTTYRSLAEQAVNQVFETLGQTSPRCKTAAEPLPGAASPNFVDFTGDFKQRCGLPEKSSEHLLRVYGTCAWLVMRLVAEDPSLADIFDDETGAIAAEVVFAFQEELAETLADCLLRRTMVGLNSSRGLNAVAAAASVARRHLGWSEGRVNREIDAYREEVNARLSSEPEAR